MPRHVSLTPITYGPEPVRSLYKTHHRGLHSFPLIPETQPSSPHILHFTTQAMFPRILCAAAALAAAAPLVSALPNDVSNRHDFIYQEFADKVKLFIAENGCGGDSSRNPKTGRVLPPLWLRLIFHDSGDVSLKGEGGDAPPVSRVVSLRPSPHPFRPDSTATWFQSNGSFGLDGSIIFELGRPGNEGLAIADMAHHTSVLMPDTMNLAAIATIAACGGPEIQFTSGLKHPGPDPHHLLPLPSDPNELSVENMFRMGFNASQVVAIVTGSHTLGGLHAANNPHLTSLEFAPFDFTPTVFDNNIFK
ncbi:heme peroxidase [Blyttiomyces helicus]|uniref:Peroxidase n=1 Tax=Blyttiomyces helicus TaxID=388810 RepID=A0A4P9VZ81_9FUNG|nr:heme peroxidase [Blyttiomyces helicus]|eukprot:RKO84295.1 heme peroxidase [Blyttiomyces helicus]